MGRVQVLVNCLLCGVQPCSLQVPVLFLFMCTVNMIGQFLVCGPISLHVHARRYRFT